MAYQLVKGTELRTQVCRFQIHLLVPLGFASKDRSLFPGKLEGTRSEKP